MISRPYASYAVGIQPPGGQSIGTNPAEFRRDSLEAVIKEEIDKKGVLGYLSDSFQRFVGLKPTLTDEDVKALTKNIVEATSGNLTGSSGAGISPNQKGSQYGLIPYLLLPTIQQAEKQKQLNNKSSTSTSRPAAGSSVKPVTKPGIICKPCAAGYTRAASTGCACKACTPCKLGYTRSGSSGCACKQCKPCAAGYIRSGTTGCGCKACKPCAAGYRRGSSGCSCVATGGGAYFCPYSGCGSTTSKSQCFLCRCRGICNNAAHGGVKSVASNGTCHCNR